MNAFECDVRFAEPKNHHVLVYSDSKNFGLQIDDVEFVRAWNVSWWRWPVIWWQRWRLRVKRYGPVNGLDYQPAYQQGFDVRTFQFEGKEYEMGTVSLHEKGVSDESDA